MEGFVNENIVLSCRLDDGLTTLYPQVTIFNKDGTLVTTKNLTHSNDGYYQDGTWSPPSSGHFTLNYNIYTDVGRTSLSADYNLCTEHLFIIDYIALSSQTRGISSQLYNISSNLPLGQWHGEGAWGASVSVDLTEISTEIDYISSQINWLSGMAIGVSSQIYGISSMVFNTPPGAGATAAQVWAYADRSLSTDSNLGYISSQVTYISSQSSYISSQLTIISSQIEPYGGGGGRSYVAYTSKQGPWKYAEKERILKDVKDILNAVDGLEKQAEEFHKEEIQKLLHSEKTILTSIGHSLTHLNHLKQHIEASEEKDLKLLSSVDTSINNLNIYKVDVEGKFKELESCLGDILSLLGNVTPLDRLEELEAKEVNEEQNG